MHTIHGDTHDNWSYIWGSDKFEVKKAYSAMIGYSPSPPHFSWVWASSCQNKHKFFFWLLLLDRLNTRNLLKRKQFILPDYNCVTSNCYLEESVNHLFWECPFANKCWDHIYRNRTANLTGLEAISDIKEKLHLPFAMEIIIMTTWGIWICRNEKIFNDNRPTIERWKAIFYQEMRWLQFRIKGKYKEKFKAWLNQQLDQG